MTSLFADDVKSSVLTHICLYVCLSSMAMAVRLTVSVPAWLVHQQSFSYALCCMIVLTCAPFCPKVIETACSGEISVVQRVEQRRRTVSHILHWFRIKYTEENAFHH